MLSSEIRKLARENLAGRWKQIVIIALIFGLISGALTYVSNLTNHMPVVGIVVAIAVIVVSIPLSYGLSGAMLKFKRKENVEIAEFITFGFSQIGRAWAVTGHMILKMIVPFVFLVVFLGLMFFSGVSLITSGYLFFSSGFFTQTMLVQSVTTSLILAGVGAVGAIIASIFMIPKVFLYSLSYAIAIDNPDMKPKDAVEKSAELMKGNRWKLFCLFFSFIGWAILTGLVAGIGATIFMAVPAVNTIIAPAFDCFLLPYMFISFVIFYENLAGKLGTVEVKATPAAPAVEEAKPQEKPVVEEVKPQEEPASEEPIQTAEKETEDPIQNTEENNEGTNE